MTFSNFDQMQPGWDVYSNEGQHIGTVDDVNGDFIVVKKGLLLTKDYFIPQDGIMQVKADQGQVFLNCAKADLDSMGWDREPAVGTAGTTDRTSLRESTGETQRIPRYEEELRAEKSSREAGEVTIGKTVTEHDESFEVPVTREDVEVRRVAVNRPATENDTAFQDGDTIRVPVRAEQVEVTKEPRIVEEIEVRKTARQDTQRVSDTVRREEFDVNRSGDVDVRDRGGELVGAGADRMQSTSLDDTGETAADTTFEDPTLASQGAHPVDVDQDPEEADRSKW